MGFARTNTVESTTPAEEPKTSSTPGSGFTRTGTEASDKPVDATSGFVRTGTEDSNTPVDKGTQSEAEKLYNYSEDQAFDLIKDLIRDYVVGGGAGGALGVGEEHDPFGTGKTDIKGISLPKNLLEKATSVISGLNDIFHKIVVKPLAEITEKTLEVFGVEQFSHTVAPGQPLPKWMQQRLAERKPKWFGSNMLNILDIGEQNGVYYRTIDNGLLQAIIDLASLLLLAVPLFSALRAGGAALIGNRAAALKNVLVSTLSMLNPKVVKGLIPRISKQLDEVVKAGTAKGATKGSGKLITTAISGRVFTDAEIKAAVAATKAGFKVATPTTILSSLKALPALTAKEIGSKALQLARPLLVGTRNQAAAWGGVAVGMDAYVHTMTGSEELSEAQIAEMAYWYTFNIAWSWYTGKLLSYWRGTTSIAGKTLDLILADLFTYVTILVASEEGAGAGGSTMAKLEELFARAVEQGGLTVGQVSEVLRQLGGASEFNTRAEPSANGGLVAPRLPRYRAGGVQQSSFKQNGGLVATGGDHRFTQPNMFGNGGLVANK